MTSFSRMVGNELQQQNRDCDVYVALDWMISDNTVVRPDCMIVCGKFIEDYLRFPPTLILEVASHATRIRDRNTKFSLYEMSGVEYYVLADDDKASIEMYELVNNKYQQTASSTFILHDHCSIEPAVLDLWKGFNADSH